MTSDILDTVIGKSENPQAAEDHYQRGLEADREGNRSLAIKEMRAACRLSDNPEHLFRLAYLLDLAGEEDEAVAKYETLCDNETPHFNALINLAVVYEDRNEVAKAEKCLRMILDTNPNHLRAKLFLKDIQASRDMFYDEEEARDRAKKIALMNTPVTDFELSVRARNCLKKMSIRTLGDLLRISEAELLSYKNFGETSLTEIKHMLTVKGLRLGQGVDGQLSRARQVIYEELRGQASDTILNKSIAALDLSVRARKALQMLTISTIGDLAIRTEAELMGVKNFGSTSLVEIREKLGKFGLTLREID